jgi:hypothetical protein
MNQRWLATFTAVVAVFLAIVGGMGAWGFNAANDVTPDPLSPFGTSEYVAWAKSAMPVFGLMAVEGLGLSALAFASAVGLLLRRKWAHRALVAGSFVLSALSVSIIAIAPGTWDVQIIFLLFCVLLWWQLWQWRRSNVSAF